MSGDFFKEQETLDYEPFKFKVLKLDRYRIAQVQVVYDNASVEDEK